MALVFSETTTADTGGTFVGTGAVYDSGHATWILLGIRSPANVAAVQYSTDDGATWILADLPSTDAHRAIAYAPTLGTAGRLVAIGNGVADWSDDGGRTWTATTSLPEANAWIDVKWWPAQSIFVMLALQGGAHQVGTSTDGKSWTMQTAAASKGWAGLEVSGTTAVAVAFSGLASTQLVMTSIDGATWTLQTHASLKTSVALPSVSGRMGLGYSADLDMFVFAGTDGSGITKAYRSTDSGVTWTASNTIPTLADATARSFLWLASLSQWVMFCTDAHLGASTDGITWTVTDTSGAWSHSGYTQGAWDDSGQTAIVASTASLDGVLRGVIPVLVAVSPPAGTRRGGTVLTMTGKGLSSVATGDILIGGTPATDVVPATDGRAVTCLTPAHAVGTVDVVVTGVGTLTGAYTYVSVDRVTPKAGSAAGGETVTITGYGFTAATGVLFDMAAATDVVIVSTTQITCTTPYHRTGTVDVTVSGVDVGAQLFTYELRFTFRAPVSLMPPLPKTPIADKDGMLSRDWYAWFSQQKQRVETPPSIVAEQVAGTLGADNLPDNIPWGQISKTGSSLADLGTRNAGDLTVGTLPAARFPALTGDVTAGPNATATTLAATGVTAATYGDSTHVPQIAVDAKGRITSAANVAIAASGGGKIAQIVNTETGAVQTGTTTIPFDDTKPQNTEGTEFFTVTVTPTDATHKLRIDVTVFATVTTTPWIIAALFQDSGADAIAVAASFNNLNTAGMTITFTHHMVAGTTSATTFKVRVGPSSAATVTLNGQSGGRIFGGVAVSGITVTEYAP